jgi:hypothetical protein
LSSLSSSVATVVGGRHSEALVARGVVHVATMSELSAYATALLSPHGVAR